MLLKNKFITIASAGAFSIVAAALMLQNSSDISSFFDQDGAEETASVAGVLGTDSDSSSTSLGGDSFYEPCSFQTDSNPNRDVVVFSEVAWMGDKNGTGDEWFSIKKIGPGSLDISGYQILNGNEKINIVIPKNTVLSDDSPMYVLARKDGILGVNADLIFSGAIRNTGEGLRLFDNNCHLLDEVFASPSWPAGDNTTKETMKRNFATLEWFDLSHAVSLPTETKTATLVKETATTTAVMGLATTTNIDPEGIPSPTVPPAAISEKININNANKDELMTLAGIGGVKAQAIIDYRDNVSQFYKIQDIINVSGIGQSIFDSIKDKITTGDSAVGYEPALTGDEINSRPLLYTINLLKGGNGNGEIKDESGILCGTGCSQYSKARAYGDVLSLSAVAVGGSEFSGWSGACFGSGICQIAMNDSKTVTANFNLEINALPLPTPTMPASQESRILISEVMAGVEGNSSYEFIELYNSGSNEADLSGWTIKKKSSTGSETTLVAASRLLGKTIPAGKYFLLANDGGYSGQVSADAAWPSSYGLAYSNNGILLYDNSGRLVDQVSWQEIPSGQSLSRDSWDSSGFSLTVPTPQNLLD